MHDFTTWLRLLYIGMKGDEKKNWDQCNMKYKKCTIYPLLLMEFECSVYTTQH